MLVCMSPRLRLLVLLPFVGLLATAAPSFATEDTTSPVVSAVRLLSGPVLTPGQDIVAEVDVSDPSGVSETTLWFQDSVGQLHYVAPEPEQDLSDGTVTVRRTIDETWSSGPYTLREIGVGDLVGNYTGHLSGGALDVDFTSVTFSIDNPDAPVRHAPVVESIGRQGRAAAGVGQEVRTIITTSSADGVVRSIGLFYRGPDGQLRNARAIAGDSRPATLVGDTDVIVRPESDWAPGRYTLEQIVVEGYDGRPVAFYHRNGLLSRIPDGPTEHSLDLAALDLRVVGRAG